MRTPLDAVRLLPIIPEIRAGLAGWFVFLHFNNKVHAVVRGDHSCFSSGDLHVRKCQKNSDSRVVIVMARGHQAGSSRSRHFMATRVRRLGPK